MKMANWLILFLSLAVIVSTSTTIPIYEMEGTMQTASPCQDACCMHDMEKEASCCHQEKSSQKENQEKPCQSCNHINVTNAGISLFIPSDYTTQSAPQFFTEKDKVATYTSFLDQGVLISIWQPPKIFS